MATLEVNRQANQGAIDETLATLGSAGKPYTLAFHPTVAQIDSEIGRVLPAQQGQLFSFVASILRTLSQNTSGYAHRTALASSKTIRIVMDRSKPSPSCTFRDDELTLLFPLKAFSNPSAYQNLGKGLPNALKVGPAANLPSYAQLSTVAAPSVSAPKEEASLVTAAPVPAAAVQQKGEEIPIALGDGELSKGLKANFAKHEPAMLKHLGEFGAAVDGGAPFRLVIDAKLADELLAESERKFKNRVFDMVTVTLKRMAMRIKRLQDPLRTTFVSLTSTKRVVEFVVTMKGGYSFEDIAFHDGAVQLVYGPYSLELSLSNQKDIGEYLVDILPASFKKALKAGGPDGQELRKIHQHGIDESLRKLAFWMHDDTLILKLSPEAVEMEAQITKGDPEKEGHLLEVLAFCLDKLHENSSGKLSNYKRCAKDAIIEFRIGEALHRHHGSGLTMLLHEDRSRVTMVGAAEDFCMEANKKIGKDFKREFTRVYGIRDWIDASDRSDDCSTDGGSSGGGGGGVSSAPSNSGPNAVPPKQRTCGHCKGHGHRTCTLCHGRGCQGNKGCKGSGRANAKCSSCRGTGMK